MEALLAILKRGITCLIPKQRDHHTQHLELAKAVKVLIRKELHLIIKGYLKGVQM